MTAKIDYPKELNAAQLEAVLSTEGPHLVIAGAGSGKTRVLVFRTAYLVEKGISPENILLLTFTRRASQEMLTRASQILDDRCQKVAGGTFHSFAHTTLRRYAQLAGIPSNFTILDDEDAQNTVNLAMTQLKISKQDKRFPKKGTLLDLISKSVNKCVDVSAIIYDEYPHFMEWSSTIARIQEEYERYKLSMGMLDYDDLLVMLRDLLASNEDLRRQLSRRYQYIMVDEFQDTNKIQSKIVQLLTSEHKNLMVVGDDSQSIYSFRGAHFRNIIDFPQVYPGTKVITLEENYRSCQPILDLTNEVIQSASEKFEKNLFSNKEGTGRPVYVDVWDENGQSKYIVKKILDLRRQGVPLKEIAVLFRSGWHSNDLEVELAGHGIPFIKYGGQKFVEAAHVKDVMAFLRVAQNPMDEVNWSRVLTLLPGVGAKGASQIIEEVVRNRKIFDPDERFLQKKEAVARLFEVFKRADINLHTPAELLRIFLEFYQPILISQYDDYDKRLSDMDSLDRIVSRYDSLEQFLSDMALDPIEKSAVDRGPRHTGDHLVISTIHSAKGLEWHTVFLISLSEGYLPSYRAMDNDDAIEEERRLFYVATTRAKDNLYLLRPRVDASARAMRESGGSMYTRVSRFLEEGRILTRFVKIESDNASRYQSNWNSF